MKKIIDYKRKRLSVDIFKVYDITRLHLMFIFVITIFYYPMSILHPILGALMGFVLSYFK
jgi:hypothetical protein